MTKKKVKKNFRRKGFVAIPFSATLALSTTADGAVLSGPAMAAFGEDIFIISCDIQFIIVALTAGQVPIMVGFSHGDLSDAEIAEFLAAELTDPDDIIARERSRRPVRRVGNMVGDVNAVDLNLNNGIPIRQPIRFSVGDGHTFNFWGQNRTGAVLTTGAILKAEGTLFGRWQR